MISLRIHTIAHAWVVATLQVVKAKTIVVGEGKYRKRIVRSVVLYRTTVKGGVNSSGWMARTLHITYKVTKPTAARIVVSARKGRDTNTRTTVITIRPAIAWRAHHMRRT